MEILDTKTNTELLRSILAEIAKAQNEIRHGKADIEKAQGRINFLLVVVNKMIERTKD
jgi:hypothetical protein